MFCDYLGLSKTKLKVERNGQTASIPSQQLIKSNTVKPELYIPLLYEISKIRNHIYCQYSV